MSFKAIFHKSYDENILIIAYFIFLFSIKTICSGGTQLPNTGVRVMYGPGPANFQTG